MSSGFLKSMLSTISRTSFRLYGEAQTTTLRSEKMPAITSRSGEPERDCRYGNSVPWTKGSRSSAVHWGDLRLPVVGSFSPNAWMAQLDQQYWPERIRV